MQKPSELQTYLSDIGVATHFLLVGAAGVVAWVFFDPWMGLAFAAGWCSYVVEEHFTHRFIFHAPAPKSQFLFNALYRLHYGHHDQVHCLRLQFTPLWFSLPLGWVNLLVVSRWVPLQHAVVYVYGGGVCGYLLFEWMHLRSHLKNGRCSPWILGVKRRHARHHYIDFNHWFTVSAGGGLVDRALGKCPAALTKVDNVRTCGLAPSDQRLLSARAAFGLERGHAQPSSVIKG